MDLFLLEFLNFNPRPRIGATDYFYFIGLGPNISTHAPARGATDGQTVLHITITDFNPRPHTGCDSKLV